MTMIRAPLTRRSAYWLGPSHPIRRGLRFKWEFHELGIKRCRRAYSPKHGVEAASFSELAAAEYAASWECPHRGPDRLRLKPRLEIARPAPRGRWPRRHQIHLASIHDCCVEEFDARVAYWGCIDGCLSSWARARKLPSGDWFRWRDAWAIRDVIVLSVPRPLSSEVRASQRRRRVRMEARKEAALLCAEQAEAEAAILEAERQRWVQTFGLLGLVPGASMHEIKRAKEFVLRRMSIENAPLDDLREVGRAADEAAAYCMSRR